MYYNLFESAVHIGTPYFAVRGTKCEVRRGGLSSVPLSRRSSKLALRLTPRPTILYLYTYEEGQGSLLDKPLSRDRVLPGHQRIFAQPVKVPGSANPASGRFKTCPQRQDLALVPRDKYDLSLVSKSCSDGL